MKTKLLILGGVILVSASIWYFFLRDDEYSETEGGETEEGRSEEGADPVGPIKREHDYSNHIRKVAKEAKESFTKTDLQPDQSVPAKQTDLQPDLGAGTEASF